MNQQEQSYSDYISRLAEGSLVINLKSEICYLLSDVGWDSRFPDLSVGSLFLDTIERDEKDDLLSLLHQLNQTQSSSTHLFYVRGWNRQLQAELLFQSIGNEQFILKLLSLHSCDLEIDEELNHQKLIEQYERTIWQWHRVLETVMEHAPFFIFVKDVRNNMRYLYSNKELDPLIECKSYKNKNDHELVSAELAELYAYEDRLVIEQKSPMRFVHVEKINNEERITETIKIYVDDEPAYPILIGIVTDITEQVRQRERLSSWVVNTQEEDEFKLRLLTKFSRDLRVPLHTILSFSQLVCDTSDPKLREEYQEQLQLHSERLLKMVDELQYLSAIKSGKVEPNNGLISPLALSQDIFRITESNKHSQTQIVFESSDNDQLFVSDGVRLFQCMSYILNVACRLVYEGKIRFGYYLEKDTFIFYVHTPLLHQEIVNLNFKAFLERSSEAFPSELYLELALCDLIVRSMDGDISHQSSDSYTEFIFRLPISAV